jgi:hypothetical protein
MRRRLAVAAAALFAVAAFAAPNAFAATQTKTLNFSPMSGGASVSLFHWADSCCSGDFGYHIDITTAISKSDNAQSDLTYNDENLRQGKTLDLTNTFSNPSGNAGVSLTFDGGVTVLGKDLDITKSVSDSDSTCLLPMPSGGTEHCSHPHTFSLISIDAFDIGIASVSLDLDFVVTTGWNLDGDGVVSNRVVSIDNDPVDTQNLTFNGPLPETKDESRFIPCTPGTAGTQMSYRMDDPTTNINGEVTESAAFSVAVVEHDIITGDNDIFRTNFPDPPFEFLHKTFPQFAETGHGKSVDLGAIKPNLIPPKVNSIVIAGTKIEGKDVALNASTSSPCGADELNTVWRFSNPNATEPMVAYGVNSHIVFPDNGNWTGQITVTDPNGLSTTKDLGTIVITNADPSVAALGDKRAEWGDRVYYHADSFDAKADQGSLAYKWSFGDGSNASGQDVSHVFSTPLAVPGYAGNVDVTDKDGGVGSTGFHTIIDKRPATVVYTGPLSALTNTNVPLSATLTDDHNLPVNGGQVSFTLGGQNANAVVDSTGHAATSLVLNQVGNVTYPLSVMYGGNALYSPSLALLPGSGGVPANSFRVNKRGTTLTYLGDLDQRPNHVTMLSARLTDELNQPVVGATVLFTLGAQSISAVTDSTGLASAALTLSQGPGAYALKAAYAGDGIYNPSAAGPMTFSIPKANGAIAAIGATANVGAAKASKAVSSRIGVRRARKASGVRHHVKLVRRTK